MIKTGTIVRAKCFITDVDQHGQPYIHAYPGCHGIVLSDDPQQHDTFPNVCWEPQGHGVCNVPVEHVEIVAQWNTPEAWNAVELPEG